MSRWHPHGSVSHTLIVMTGMRWEWWHRQGFRLSKRRQWQCEVCGGNDLIDWSKNTSQTSVRQKVQTLKPSLQLSPSQSCSITAAAQHKLLWGNEESLQRYRWVQREPPQVGLSRNEKGCACEVVLILLDKTLNYSGTVVQWLALLPSSKKGCGFNSNPVDQWPVYGRETNYHPHTWKVENFVFALNASIHCMISPE